jgi:5-methylcytosine-specific restriction endonuclease McrA
MQKHSKKAYRELQRQVLERDNNKCVICNTYTESPPHHIIYKSEGGKDEFDNMATLCDICHYSIHHRGLKSLIDSIITYHGLKKTVQYFLLGLTSR